MGLQGPSRPVKVEPPDRGAPPPEPERTPEREPAPTPAREPVPAGS